MAEHGDSTEGLLRDSSTSSNDPLRMTSSVEAGGKSPGKAKKTKKSSLFKKSVQDEGNFIRSSGRGKRKSAREKKLESRDIVEEHPQAEVSAPQVQRAEASYQYDINSQEVEQKSTIDLSIKKIQKQNKELEKKNSQLLKSMDTLKKERELLLSERLKLKNENKSLEKELKKVGSKDRLKKSSQPSFEEIPFVDADVLRDKIQILEEQLTEKDRIATLLKFRLDNMDLHEGTEQLEEFDRSSNSIHTKNGAIVDSATALEMLVEEHDNSLKLKRENDNLKSRLMAVEAELEAHKAHREFINPSPKSPRKKSSNFFKRGKKNTSSMKEEVRQDFMRSQSPDVIVKSESIDQLDVSVSPLMPFTTNKESSVSLPCYGSPNHSPRLSTKNKMDAEIIALQSCLKLAIEEKGIYNEDKLQLEKELDGAKSKIAELEEAISTSAENTSTEIENLKSSLKSAEIERDTYCEELKIIQSEIDEMTEKNESVEEMYTKSLSEKNKRIEELEQEIETLKKNKIASPSHHKPPVYGVAAAPRKIAVSPVRERLVSPPYQGKASAESTGSSTDKTQQSSREITPERPRERLSSTESSPKHKKPGKLCRDRSQEKLVKTVPPSPTRKVGRLSRESSIDRFEMPIKEDKRKISNSGISSPSLVHSPKVAATRAMFEQKIDETKNIKRPLSKSSLFERRRSSLSTENAVTDAKQKTHPQHSKSYSCDYSAKQTLIQKKSESSTGNAAKPKLVSPTPVMERVDEPEVSTNEAKSTANSCQDQKHDMARSSAANTVSKPSTLPANSSESVTKVSRITVTSTASPSGSPVCNRKEFKVTSPKGDRSTSPSAVLTRAPTSPSLNTSRSSTATSAPRGQFSTTTKVSTVSATVRHSNPSKAATMSEISLPSSKTHLPVAKSQTESKLQPPSSRGTRVWSGSSQSTQVSSTTTTTSNPTPNRVVVKTTSRLGDNLLSSVNKAGSLQNLPSQIDENTTPQSSSESNTKTSTVTTSSVIRRGPTHKAMQRRERKDRPKTMYAGRAETTNLVNLISRFQEAEKEKKSKEGATPSQSSPTTSNPPKVNGTSSPIVASSSGPASPAHTSGIPTSVPLRQGGVAKQARPTSYHSSNNPSISINKPGLNFHSSSSFGGSSKPLPHERILQRSRTVAGGLGSNKLSKRAMLLKWCQIMTEDYENVNICNFAESFSNGLAFCALMHRFLPDQIPFNKLDPANRENNFTIAFQTAENAGIPSLLDVEDMVSLPTPDWMSVMTYVSFIYNKFGQQTQPQSSSMV